MVDLEHKIKINKMLDDLEKEIVNSIERNDSRDIWVLFQTFIANIIKNIKKITTSAETEEIYNLLELNNIKIEANGNYKIQKEKMIGYIKRVKNKLDI